MPTQQTSVSVNLPAPFRLGRAGAPVDSYISIIGTPAYPFVDASSSPCSSLLLSCIVWTATYKKVPPLNSRSTPVANSVLAPLPRVERPSKCAAAHVTSAPTGAAREKMARWARAARFVRPCLSSTEVRPKAAGALWIISAMKIMKVRWLVVVVEEAPRAMPSAMAWMTNPTVVEDGREVC